MKALTVAEYILKVAYENGDLISNLKMQKLLYYAQAWFLVNNNNKPLFEDDILAWKYGPIVKTVYDEYKTFNRGSIDYEIKNNFSELDKNAKIFLKEFCLKFFGLSATELVSMTHNEQPWKTAWAMGVGTVIDVNEMYSFYKNMNEA